MEERTPSQEHDTDSINGLVESVRLQSKNIDALASGFAVMGEQISDRPTRSGVWKIVGIVGTLVVTLIIGLSALAYAASSSSLDEIKSCTDPQGECAQQGAKSQAQAVGQIVCNQEKVVYFVENEYEPFPYCIEYINSEIDRTGFDAPKMPVPDVEQFAPKTG